MGTKRRATLAFLRNNFLAGITVLLPLWAVYFIVMFILTVVNDNFLNPILKFIRPYLQWADPQSLEITAKSIIFVIIILLITTLGVLVKNYFVRQLLHYGEGILIKIPFINKIYVAIQQISSVFLVSKKALFNKAVLIEYPRKGIYSVGLVTTDAKGEVQSKTADDLISVFIPTTPNPTSGFLLFVPKNEVTDLNMSVEDSLKLIISGGTVTPQSQSSEKKS